MQGDNARLWLSNPVSAASTPLVACYERLDAFLYRNNRALAQFYDAYARGELNPACAKILKELQRTCVSVLFDRANVLDQLDAPRYWKVEIADLAAKTENLLLLLAGDTGISACVPAAVLGEMAHTEKAISDYGIDDITETYMYMSFLVGVKGFGKEIERLLLTLVLRLYDLIMCTNGNCDELGKYTKSAYAAEKPRQLFYVLYRGYLKQRLIRDMFLPRRRLSSTLKDVICRRRIAQKLRRELETYYEKTCSLGAYSDEARHYLFSACFNFGTRDFLAEFDRRNLMDQEYIKGYHAAFFKYYNAKLERYPVNLLRQEPADVADDDVALYEYLTLLSFATLTQSLDCVSICKYSSSDDANMVKCVFTRSELLDGCAETHATLLNAEYPLFVQCDLRFCVLYRQQRLIGKDIYRTVAIWLAIMFRYNGMRFRAASEKNILGTCRRLVTARARLQIPRNL